MSSSQHKGQASSMILVGSSDSESEKRSRGPVKRARIDISCTEKGSLLNLLANPRFSDVKVIVGEERLEYNLHRAIICLDSTFFEAACNGGFKEGNTGEINLPDIQPGAFDVVARWLYKGGFSIKGKLSPEQFCELYKATDFLGIDSLKNAMMSEAAHSLQEDIRKPADRVVDNPMSLIHSLTEIAPLSDWQVIRQVTDKVVPHRQLTAASLRNMADSNPSEHNSFFPAMLLDSWQEFVNSVFCGACIKVVRNNPGNCKNCRKTFNYQKRDGPPIKSEKSS